MDKLSREELIKQFNIVLKRVDLKCMYTDIIKEIPHLTWKKIKQHAVQKKIGFTTENVASIICKHVSKPEECDNKKLIELITFTDLVYTAKYSYRKMWHTFQLEKRDTNLLQLENIRQSLNMSFHRQNISHQIHLYRYDGIVWIQIFISNKSKRAQINKNYFAFVLEDDYIFSTTKTIKPVVIDALKDALLSKEIKGRPLNGRLIKSLIQLIKNKENKTQNLDGMESDFALPDKKNSFTKTDFGYDFTKTKFLNEYANAVIGKEPAILQTLTLKPKKSINLRRLLNDDKLPEEFDMQIRITSPNIMNCVKNLIENNVIPTPAPSWVTQLPFAGSNIIKIKKGDS